MISDGNRWKRRVSRQQKVINRWQNCLSKNMSCSGIESLKEIIEARQHVTSDSAGKDFYGKKDNTQQICTQRYCSASVFAYLCSDGRKSLFIDKDFGSSYRQCAERGRRDFNQIILYGTDVTAVTVLNSARRFPMMAEHQLVVVREAQLIKDIKLLTTYVQNRFNRPSLVICYKYKTLDRRKTLALAAEKERRRFLFKRFPIINWSDSSSTLYINGSIRLTWKRPKCSQII